jgi:tRNA 5-methylaminomethyl-2-thiouridine biosynthesis bifunctional protein
MNASKKAIIVGAGLAGASCAYMLANKLGYEVIVVEKNNAFASGASAITAANLYPRFDAEPSMHMKFYYDCYNKMQCHWRQLICNQQVRRIYQPGMLVALKNDKEFANKSKFLQHCDFAKDQMWIVDVAHASKIAGIAITVPCLFLPNNVTASIPELCKFYLSHPSINLLLNHEVRGYKIVNDRYEVQLTNDIKLDAEVLILCHGDAEGIETYTIRGQSTHLPPQPSLENLKTTISFGRSLTPAFDSCHHLGSTFERHNNSLKLELASQRDNFIALQNFFPDLELLEPAGLKGECGLRRYTKNKLPIIKQITSNPYLFVSTGHGARGLLSCMPAATFIVDRLNI